MQQVTKGRRGSKPGVKRGPYRTRAGGPRGPYKPRSLKPAFLVHLLNAFERGALFGVLEGNQWTKSYVQRTYGKPEAREWERWFRYERYLDEDAANKVDADLTAGRISPKTAAHRRNTKCVRVRWKIRFEIAYLARAHRLELQRRMLTGDLGAE